AGFHLAGPDRCLGCGERISALLRRTNGTPSLEGALYDGLRRRMRRQPFIGQAMSKATRIRRENAREKIAAQRAAARRAEMRRRVFITAGSILAVVVVVVAFIVIKATNKPASSSASSASCTALPASVVKNLTTVPASTLTAVGPGTAYAKSVTSISGTPLTASSKPEVLYIGAEYC